MNIIESDEQRKENLKEWMKYRSVNQIAEIVLDEMDSFKGYLTGMSMKEATSKVLEEFDIQMLHQKFEDYDFTLYSLCHMSNGTSTKRKHS